VDFAASQLVGPGRHPLDRAPSANQNDRSQANAQQRVLDQAAGKHFPHRVRRGFGDRPLPALGFRHVADDEQRQQRGGRAREHDPAPGIAGDLEQRAQQAQQAEPDVRGGADGARQQWTMPFRPAFHDQGHAQRPFPPHAHRGEEAEHTQLPRRLGEITRAGEQGIGQNAQHHRPHPAQAVPQPPKSQPA